MTTIISNYSIPPFLTLYTQDITLVSTTNAAYTDLKSVVVPANTFKSCMFVTFTCRNRRAIAVSGNSNRTNVKIVLNATDVFEVQYPVCVSGDLATDEQTYTFGFNSNQAAPLTCDLTAANTIKIQGKCTVDLGVAVYECDIRNLLIWGV